MLLSNYHLGFSLIEMCALVAMKRTRDKAPDEIVTFDALYEEYAVGFSHSEKASSQVNMLGHRFQKAVMRAAVDGLIEKGVLISSSSAALGETVGYREELSSRLPLFGLPDMLEKISSCPTTLVKLASEAF